MHILNKIYYKNITKMNKTLHSTPRTATLTHNKVRWSIMGHLHTCKRIPLEFTIAHPLYIRFAEAASAIHRFPMFDFFFKLKQIFDFFISPGTNSQVFGPKYLIVSTPLFTVFTLGSIISLFPTFLQIKRSCIGFGQSLCFTLYISTANF